MLWGTHCSICNMPSKGTTFYHIYKILRELEQKSDEQWAINYRIWSAAYCQSLQADIGDYKQFWSMTADKGGVNKMRQPLQWK